MYYHTCDKQVSSRLASDRLYSVVNNMLHNRASQTTAACTEGSVWGSSQRDGAQIEEAISCLAHGQGTWKQLRKDTEQTEPYILHPELRLGREKRHWWGICDDDLAERNKSQPVTSDATIPLPVRPPRPALLFEWAPEGSGCAALRKRGDLLPDHGALACAFCARHAGRSVLFVGDSVQGELFLAFASILGVRRHHVNPGNEGCRRVAPKGSGRDELDVTLQVCGEGEREVTVRFIRNELLWLDDEQNARRRHPDFKFGAPALMLCDWVWAAATTDFLVLNRGYHSLLDSNIDEQLAQLNGTLLELGSRMRGSRARPLRHRVVYRGTHGSVHNCFALEDPLRRPWSAVSAKMSSRSNAQYNWRAIEGREARTKLLLHSHGLPYLDAFGSTSYRPGGRMPPGNCNQ
jgi:hypothetical protein